MTPGGGDLVQKIAELFKARYVSGRDKARLERSDAIVGES